jgi:5-methylcytosine-specific restriction enzyme subunit McrC
MKFSVDCISSPYFAYQEVTEEMAFVRGRITMQPYINKNLAKGRHQLLYCTYEPFLYDNQFNRIVKHTCTVLQTVSRNRLNRVLLNDIIFLLDEVTDVYCKAEDCIKVKSNRLYHEVGVITNMCESFLYNQSYTDGLLNNQNLSILLPMEVIYEQYIAGFIKKYLPKLKLQAQASGEYVELTGKDFTTSVFQMKHDILLPDKMIIDTKLKFREMANDSKAGVSQNDLYQIVTYCYKRKMKNGILLYPKHFGENAENGSKEFKVEDIFITACSIEITENDFENFDEGQIEKVSQIIF